jgi:type IV secretory pathway component VirB8
MEEMEVPMEHLHEKIKEEAEERMEKEKEKEKEKWVLYVALSTAFIAVLAAIAGLLAGHHANEALIGQVKSSDQWSFYQSKSIKSEIAASTDKILHTLSAKPVEDNAQALARYEKEKEGIKEKAEEFEKDSEAHLTRHLTFAKAVTIFQISIAIAAIAIITKKRMLWLVSMILASIGIFFMLMGLL